MKAGKPCLFNLFTELVESFACGLNRAKAIQEQLHLVNREIGLAVDFPITGMFEIPADDQIGDGIPSLGFDYTGIEQLDRFGGIVSLNIIPVVIGPIRANRMRLLLRALRNPSSSARSRYGPSS